MPALKFRFEGLDFEYVGNNDEIRDFIHTFLGQTMHLPEHQTATITRNSRIVIKEKEDEGLINVPLPSDEMVMDFLESKKDFAHNIEEIQAHFFGKTFGSRGNSQRMYHRTARQLSMVREKLEKQFEGKFMSESTGVRNLRRYVFKPSQKVLLNQ
jgi:hypothetical protein